MKYNPPRYLLRRHVVLRELISGDNFLEIGPGEFLLTKEFARRFDRGTLVEFHAESRQLYMENIPENLRANLQLVVEDFTKMHLTGFDCVVACEVMEHVDDDGGFLDRINDTLNPGGQVIISVPAHMRYWSGHDEAVGHLRRYEKDELVAKLENHGFTEIKIFSYGIPFIHIFRLLRILKEKISQDSGVKDIDERTKQSGVHHIGRRWDWIGLLINPKTFYPLNWLSALFEKTDWSDGYVIVGKKSQ